MQTERSSGKCNMACGEKPINRSFWQCWENSVGFPATTALALLIDVDCLYETNYHAWHLIQNVISLLKIQQDSDADGEAMFLLSGTLTKLHTARKTVDLLERLQQRRQAGNVVTEAAAVLGDMHGLVATSASLALYDGEDAFNFAAVLGNDVICGVFNHADALSEGDHYRRGIAARRRAVLPQPETRK